MHTYVIKVLFKSKIFTRILNKVYFIKSGFFANYEDYILVRDRLVVKPSSNIVRTGMNARIWLSFCIPGIS